MTKESKFIYGMVAVSLLLVGAFFVLWKISTAGMGPGSGKSGTAVERWVAGDVDLVDADGQQRGFQQLKGKVSLVSNVFTRCPGQCAGICAALDEIRAELEGQGPLQLVSVSLDPEHDTPAQLKQFAQTHELVRDDWWFVTGEPGPLNKYMLDVFLISAKPKPPEQRVNEFDLFDHQAVVVLVDHELKLLGWYYPFDQKSAKALREDLRSALAAAKEAA